MEILKRNGKPAPFDFSKAEKVIRFACPTEDHYKRFEDGLMLSIRSGMTTKDLQRTLIQFAAEKTSVAEPDWDKVAAKLYIYDLIKEAGINRGYKKYGYGNFYKLLKDLTEQGLYGDYVLKGYKKAEVEELGAYIDPERDYLLTYIGVKTLAERYCIRGFKKETLELPQESFMGVAMTLALAEKPENRVRWAKEFYDALSQLYMTVATPTMSSARKPFKQLSSCFIGTMGDSLESIYNVVDSFAQVSKHGGGMGVYVGKIRAMNSDIRGFKGAAGGVIPWVRVLNDTAVACDQLGVRKGSVAITLDVWHKDIWEFMNLKTNNGDERRKAHDIFPSISIPDVFMKQIKEKGKFYLFCPHEIEKTMGYRLEDCYDDGVENLFTKRYWDCVNHPELSKVEINAMDILKAIIKSDTETGTPFLFFRDTVNRLNPNKHAGIIYCSNLCHEICQNTSENGELESKLVTDKDGNDIVVYRRKAGDFVVCNLASLALGRTHTKETLAKIVPLAIRMMDNVIDLNFYPVEEARSTNKRYRAVGLGTFGYHHMLALKGIRWESEEHIKAADEVYEMINFYAIKASMDLAKEKGSYPLFEGSDWQTGEYFRLRDYNTPAWKELQDEVAENGMRNGYLVAVAPNGSSAHYGGSTQSIDPVYEKLYWDEKKNQVVPIVAPDLNASNVFIYKAAHLIDQWFSIEANAKRQRHIDQSQSFNLYITPETKASELARHYIHIWESGGKTLYYTRSRSVEIEDCVSCSA